MCPVYFHRNDGKVVEMSLGDVLADAKRQQVTYCKCYMPKDLTPLLVVVQDGRVFAIFWWSPTESVDIVELPDGDGIWPAGRYHLSFRYRYGGRHQFLSDEFTSAGKVIEYSYSPARAGRISGGHIEIEINVKWPFVPPPLETANTTSELIGKGSDGKPLSEYKVVFTSLYYAVVASHSGIKKDMLWATAPIVADGAVRINLPHPLPNRRVWWSSKRVEVPYQSIEVPGTGSLYERLRALRDKIRSELLSSEQ